MRKCYFPVHVFSDCRVYRGVIGSLPGVLQDRGEQAAVILWKKSETVKRLYAATVENFDFQSFDPKSWSIVVFFNTDGFSAK